MQNLNSVMQYNWISSQKYIPTILHHHHTYFFKNETYRKQNEINPLELASFFNDQLKQYDNNVIVYLGIVNQISEVSIVRSFVYNCSNERYQRLSPPATEAVMFLHLVHC